ncbi:hypothetical protein [Streptococcus danieliae]|uniref:hypothetical protein n=1 Tax=Streptococcus danieliae TaxID=747656 RepID=UPI0039C09743
MVQHLTNAFKMIRIQEMNKLNRHSGEEAKKYRRLKRFWRLSQKDYSCLSSESKYYPLFDRYISAQDIALELANYSPVLGSLSSCVESLKTDSFRLLLFSFLIRVLRWF